MLPNLVPRLDVRAILKLIPILDDDAVPCLKPDVKSKLVPRRMVPSTIRKEAARNDLENKVQDLVLKLGTCEVLELVPSLKTSGAEDIASN